jgi:hypothetical protein
VGLVLPKKRAFHRAPAPTLNEAEADENWPDWHAAYAYLVAR